MMPEPSGADNEVRPPNPPQMASEDRDIDGGATALEDLPGFGQRWSHDLESALDPVGRAVQHQLGGATAQAAIDQDVPGSWEFGRTWLSRLADDAQRGRLELPLEPGLERVAQYVVHSVFQHEQGSLDALREAGGRDGNPLSLVRQSPRKAGALRDMARVARALRGTGVLALESPESVEQLVAFDDTLKTMSRRAISKVPEHLRVRREELLLWADAGAGYDLPGLIRRLVSETAEGVVGIHFPSGVGATAGDWDGVVSAVIGDSYVPQGLSAWELSVEKASHAKAERDFAARNRAPDGAAMSDVTYVQVVCRPWVKARAFATAHSAEGRWKEVRAYNVDDVEAWLEHAPATTIWLAELMGRPIDGVASLDSWWASWLASTHVPLRSEVVLAGRDVESKQLRERVQVGGVTTIGGDVRLEEVRAFVAASLLEDAGDEDAPRPTPLILGDSSDAKKLLTRPGEFVAIVSGPAFMHDVLATPGHHVVIPLLGSDRGDIVLPPVSSRAVSEQLQKEGQPYHVAQELGELGRRSLLALRRRLAVKPVLHRPGWAQGADVLRRRVLLANAWNQTKAADRGAVETLVGDPYMYSQIEDSLRSLASAAEDPMVAIIDERWHVVSPMDAWLLLGPQLSIGDLEGLRRLASTVLLEPEPVEEIPEQDRWRAAFDGVTRRYSSDLTRGVVKSLALLGTLDDVVKVGEGHTGGAVAGSIVRDILDSVGSEPTADAWVRLIPHLPLLAEAAPTVVLASLTEALAPGAPLRGALFADKERGKFGSPPASPHTHVLWTLETLVWSSQHFDAAVSLLARLAELDPGGLWSNRPSRSLANVFCPWHPNTSVSAEQRIATLARLREQHPTVAWDLLRSMLPNAHGFQLLHHGPTYRDWKVSEPAVSRAEYARVVGAAANALLEDAGDDVARWVSLIKDLDDLPEGAMARARERLSELSVATDEATARDSLWQALRNFVAHHREYSDAQWALPPEEIDKLAGIAEKFAPESPLARHAWLFREGLVTLGDVHRRDDYQAYDEALAARRADAVRDVIESDGFESLLQFAAGCAIPGLVGAALARCGVDIPDERLLPHLDGEETWEIDFAFGYFSHRFRTHGWPWLDGMLGMAKKSPTLLSRLLRASTDQLAAAERADAMGGAVAAEFWRTFSYFGLGHDFADPIGLSRRLVDAGRPAAALDLLVLYARESGSSDGYAQAIAHALEALRATPDDPEMGSLSQFDMDRLLKIVAEHNVKVGKARAAALEWYFLPALGHDPDARTLHRALAEEPDFFVDILGMVYRSKDEDAEPASKPSDQEKSAAENAFRLLWSWSICPGTDERGVLDADRLRRWVDDARDALTARGLIDIGDEQIGQALAAAPADEDGTWPCEPVRVLLESLQNDRIDRGLEIRVMNNRGVTMRALDAGGQQEWELAQDYAARAERLVMRWPRTAAIYRRLADSYATDARREDAEAERRRRGLDH